MKATRLIDTITHIVKNTQHPTLVWGAPGVGKSRIIEQIAASLGADLLMSHPAVEEPIDAKGLPRFNNGEAEFVPFGNLRRACEAKSLTIWHLEDLGQAMPATQAGYMQLILARELDGKKLPACVKFTAATNRQEDRAGAHRLITPLLNRCIHLDLDVSHEDWNLWAIAANIDHRVRAFLNFKPDLLHRFDPKSPERSFPTPRSWEFTSNTIREAPESMMFDLVKGCVGEGTAAEFMAFVALYGQLPDRKVVLANPDSFPVPTQPSVLYALIGSLIQAVIDDSTNIGPFTTFASRMPDEFAVLAMRDGTVARIEVASSPEGAAWRKGHATFLA